MLEVGPLGQGPRLFRVRSDDSLQCKGKKLWTCLQGRPNQVAEGCCLVNFARSDNAKSHFLEKGIQSVVCSRGFLLGMNLVSSFFCHWCLLPQPLDVPHAIALINLL